jgi:hypothetical protein
MVRIRSRRSRASPYCDLKRGTMPWIQSRARSRSLDVGDRFSLADKTWQTQSVMKLYRASLMVNSAEVTMAVLGLGPLHERKARWLCGLTKSRSGEVSRWRSPLCSLTVLRNPLGGNANTCQLAGLHCDCIHIVTGIPASQDSILRLR